MENKQQTAQRLDQYIRARYPVIIIQSHEESRVMKTIDAVASARKRTVATWSITGGFQNFQGIEPSSTKDPAWAFEAMLEYPVDASPMLFVMKDLHGSLNDPVLVRYLRDVANRFETSRHTLILLSPSMNVPSDLEKTVVMVDFPLPDVAELSSILKSCESDLPNHIPVTLNGNREDVVNALRGLTAFEAGSVLMAAVASTGELSEKVIPLIVKEKAQIIRKANVLEFFDTSVTMGEVGGLPYLKQYAEEVREAFSAEAIKAGVDTPKGLLLVGVPGGGKSLAVKAIAGGEMPLLRMDIGSLMGGVVGASEGNMRSALKVCEAVAPCVLWIDEIENGLGGMGGSGESDGGTSLRMFGTLLTWMQENKSPVYVVATSNDARSLKDELLRRFDYTYWVDLPCFTDRVEVLAIHLQKRNQDPADFDIVAVAKAVYGFTGAEIEKVVKTAVKKAFFQKKQLSTEILLGAVGTVNPINQTSKGKIAELRAWAQTGASMAAEPLEQEATKEVAVSRMADL